MNTIPLPAWCSCLLLAVLALQPTHAQDSLDSTKSKVKAALAEKQKHSPERDVDAIGAGLESAAHALLAATVTSADDESIDLLGQLALALREMHRLPTAHDLVTRLVDVDERRFGAQHLNTAGAHALLGLILVDMGEWANAAREQETAVAVLDVLIPAGDAAIETLRLNWGDSLRHAGQLPRASEVQMRAVEGLSKLVKPDDPALLGGREQLAETLYDLGESTRPIELEEEVVTRRAATLPPEDSTLNRSRSNLAAWLLRVNEFARARALQEQVLSVYERTRKSDDADLLATRLGLAGSVFEMNDAQRARDLTTQVIEVVEAHSPRDEGMLLKARANLAAYLFALNDFAAARAVQQRVLDALESAGNENDPTLQHARSGMAIMLWNAGDMEAARALQEQAIAASEKQPALENSLLVGMRSRLAQVLIAQGDVPAARKILEKALAVLESSPTANEFSLLATRTSLATLLEQQGETDRAHALFEGVAVRTAQRLPEGHLSVAQARANVAFARAEAGDYEGARKLAESALSIVAAGLPADDGHVLTQRRNLAWMLARLGDKPALEREIEMLANGVRGGLRNLAAVSSRESLGRAATLRGQLPTLAALAPTTTVDSQARELLFSCFEESRALLEVPIGAITADLGGALHDKAQKAKGLRAQIQSLVAVETPDPASTTSLASLVRDRDAVESELRAALSSHGHAAAEIDCKRLAAELKPHEFAVAFSRYDRYPPENGVSGTATFEACVLAHVVAADGKLVRVELGSAQKIAGAVAQWRSSIGKPLERGMAVAPAVDEEAAAGAALAKLVLEPVLAVANESQVLHVCLDDALFLVPLDALPWKDAPLGTHIVVHDETSFARLLRPQHPVASEPLFLAFGGIDFNAPIGTGSHSLVEASAPVLSALRGDRAGPTGMNWGPLSETRAELEDLASLFHDVFKVDAQAFSGATATKFAFEANASHARFIHLATHGYFASQSVRSSADARPSDASWTSMSLEQTVCGLAPMTLCGLAFAGANRGMDSVGRVGGIMTAEELAGLDLSNCELAVLSACETNVGISRAGQGVQSLQAALRAAGVRTAITSLWKVDDAATRQLFEDFYTRIWVNHEPKSSALWKSKMALKKSGHPTRDWAGWVLTGDPR